MRSLRARRLQSLTLLSGGEQALTAIALIFALFLTNPAPICVLDEVDAPLDDANIDRFCDLLDAMMRETDTRYLIVTHNAVTMSRMHRLFGVTMVEQGISRLVSVDLGEAEIAGCRITGRDPDSGGDRSFEPRANIFQFRDDFARHTAPLDAGGRRAWRSFGRPCSGQRSRIFRKKSGFCGRFGRVCVVRFGVRQAASAMSARPSSIAVRAPFSV